MYRILMCVFSPQVYHEMQHGFLESGCIVKNILIGNEYSNKFDSLKKTLTEAIDEFKPDFVFSYGWWKDIIDINAYFDVIEEKGIFHVWWSADDPICCGQVSLPAAKRSNLIFTPVEELIPEYANFGIKAYLLPNACSAHCVKKKQKSEYKCDMSLVANNYSFRSVDEESKKSIFYTFRIDGIHHILKPLVTEKMNVKVYGRWWTDFDRAYILPTAFYGGVLPTQEVPYVYASSKIVLGIQQVATSKTYVSARTYEALGCGAFHITQYSEGVEYYFKKGVHLEWSKSPEETMELVKYYLTHDDKRETIARNGQQEVDNKHRLIHRAAVILDTIAHQI